MRLWAWIPSLVQGTKLRFKALHVGVLIGPHETSMSYVLQNLFTCPSLYGLDDHIWYPPQVQDHDNHNERTELKAVLGRKLGV